MKLMKKLLLTFTFVLISLLACGPKENIVNSYSSPIHTEIIGDQAIMTKRHALDRPGFDKICKKERITSNLNMWSSAVFKGYEDGDKVIQYYFVTEDSVKALSEKFYKLDLDIMNKDTLFLLEIRTATKIK